MALDLDHIRRRFADMSDDALSEVDREDLVPAAQAVYDEERARRGAPERRSAAAPRPSAPLAFAEVEPDWLETATCACTFTDFPGHHHSPEAEHAKQALEDAGIPCHLHAEELKEETPARVEWRVLVPAALALKATSVLDIEIFNAQAEADWKTHLEALSDDEFAELSVDDICAGLLDRVERLTRLYEAEAEKRQQ